MSVDMVAGTGLTADSGILEVFTRASAVAGTVLVAVGVVVTIREPLEIFWR